MGCTSSIPKVIFKIALKFPKSNDNIGISYIYYNNNNFVEDLNINSWIKKLFINKKWKYWIVFNDQLDKFGLEHTSKAHSKGILVWNNFKIGYLSHSVPSFPSSFNGNEISDIDDNGLIYGQNFCYIEFEYSTININTILNLLVNISPNIYMFNSNIKLPDKKKDNKNPIIFEINNNITFISKSSYNKIDIYDYISKEYDSNLHVQSWIRGKEIEETENIKHIKIFKGTGKNTYESSQNHSKYGISFDCNKNINIFCDLNRMTSQLERGGLAICIKNIKLWECLNSRIIRK